MAIIDKKQKQWYSKSTFDSLDKTKIPIGTEIQVDGKLGQADFDEDTNTKLNSISNKLDKPTDEITEDSIPVISSTGTVSAQPLSGLGGGKLYLHKISMTTTWEGFSDTENVHLELYNTSSTKYTLDTLIAKLKNKGPFSCAAGELSISYTAIGFEDNGSSVDLRLYDIPFPMNTSKIATIGNGVTIDSFNDDPMEM